MYDQSLLEGRFSSLVSRCRSSVSVLLFTGTLQKETELWDRGERLGIWSFKWDCLYICICIHVCTWCICICYRLYIRGKYIFDTFVVQVCVFQYSAVCFKCTPTWFAVGLYAKQYFCFILCLSVNLVSPPHTFVSPFFPPHLVHVQVCDLGLARNKHGAFLQTVHFFFFIVLLSSTTEERDLFGTHAYACKQIALVFV